MLRTHRSIAAALVLAIAVPYAAYAQPDDPATVMARTRFTEGVGFYEKGQYEAARLSFLQAWQIKKHPDILINLAWSSLKSGHVMDAEKHFLQLVHDTSLDATKKTDAQKGLDESRAKLGKIEIHAPAGTEVVMDNERLGIAPVEAAYVEPGAHMVRFKAPDGTNDTQMVSVLAGESKPARYGKVGPTPTPTTTHEPTPVPTTVPTTAPNPSTSASTTPDYSNNTAPPTTEDTGATKKTRHFWVPKDLVPAFVIGGAGLVAGVTAIVMGFSKANAQNNQNSVTAQIKAQPDANSSTCTNPTAKFKNACAALQSDIDAVNQDATAANVAAGVFGVSIGVFILYWAVAPKREKTDATTPTSSVPILAPIIGPHIGGLTLSGQF